MFKIITACLFIITCCAKLNADSLNIIHEKTIFKKFDKFSIDNLGNIYLLKKDVLTKYSPTGDSLFSQSFKLQGAVTDLDAWQALRIILFYREQAQLLILDNTLSTQADAIKLDKLGLPFITLMCHSLNNNNLWLYNTEEQNLLRVDRNFKIQINTGSIPMLVGYGINPTQIVENNDLLYLNNPATGILVFDIFGTYLKTIPLKNVLHFQPLDNGILYTINNKILYYDFLSFQEITVKTTDSTPLSFIVLRNKLYLHTSEGLEIYQIN